jgi:hypothetical protein
MATTINISARTRGNAFGGRARQKGSGRKSQCASPESVWTHDELARELDAAKRIGAAQLSNDHLLHLCRGACGHFAKHLWKAARPFFRELWRRIERHEIRGVRNKKEACRQIGCSPRWVQMILSGAADNPDRNKAKGMRTKCELNSHAQALTDEDYVDIIARHADAKLEIVKSQDWPRFREICRLLQQSFGAAARGWIHEHGHTQN